MNKVSLRLRIELPDGHRPYVKAHPKKNLYTAEGVYHEEGVYAVRFTLTASSIGSLSETIFTLPK
jgi:hypothetical protein